MSSCKGENHSEMIQTSNFFSENKEDYYIDRCDIRICLLLFTPIRAIPIHKIFEIWIRIGLNSVKIKVNTNFSITKWLFINNFFVFLQRTNIALFIVVEVRRVLSWWHTRQPTPCRVWRSQMMTKQYKAGIGWEKCSPDIMKAFTNALFKTVCNLAN